MKATTNTHTRVTTTTTFKNDLVITFSKDVRVKHKQKETTNGRRKVRFEDKKERVFNDVCFQMHKSDRAERQRNERRAKRK